MNFEKLPNEIVLYIFSHFSGADLLRTFYGLNQRLNYVLHQQFQECSFQFNALSKRDFNRICSEYLPQMSDCIPQLSLSNHEETPTEIEEFLAFNPSFRSLTQLYSLSLTELRSYSTLMQILDRCHELPNLTHLNLINGFFFEDHIDFQLMIDQIWSLPHLLHCTLGIGIKGQSFRPPTLISSTLQSISIEKFPIKLNQLNQLIEHTPQLTSLSISILTFLDNDYIATPLPSLTELSIHSIVTCNASTMDVLFRNTPNLIRLNINLLEFIDGQQWEEMIVNHLPYLIHLKIQMKSTVPNPLDIQQRLETLITSFQTPFWIEQHQWFVQGLVDKRMIYLYTIPQVFDGDLPVIFRSTSHEHDEVEFYSRMKKLTSNFFTQQTQLSISMGKIEDLSINLPLSVQFGRIVSNFHRLKSLKIDHHFNSFQHSVQAILDQAIHLSKFTICQHQSSGLQTAIFKYRNPSIRQLDLSNLNYIFNEDSCIELAQSPLGRQCEVLLICVNDCQNILSLVKQMPKLRSLNVRLKNESALHWLTERLPSQVTRSPKLSCNFLLWI